MKVACCFLESDGKIFIVARHSPKTQQREWDIPAGKIKNNELVKNTIARVVAEEAGYEISLGNLAFIGKFQFISGRNEPYTMHAYRIKIEKPFSTNLGTLQSDWVRPKECIAKNNLIKNFARLLKLVEYVD